MRAPDYAATKLKHVWNDKICFQHGKRSKEPGRKAEEEISRIRESWKTISKFSYSEACIHGRIRKIRAVAWRTLSGLCWEVQKHWLSWIIAWALQQNLRRKTEKSQEAIVSNPQESERTRIKRFQKSLRTGWWTALAWRREGVHARQVSQDG